MDNRVKANGVNFELNMRESPYEIKGVLNGWVHSARLVGKYDRDAVSKALVGFTLWGDPIIAVESFAVPTLTNCPIGILTKNKHW